MVESFEIISDCDWYFLLSHFYQSWPYTVRFAFDRLITCLSPPFLSPKSSFYWKFYDFSFRTERGALWFNNDINLKNKFYIFGIHDFHHKTLSDLQYPPVLFQGGQFGGRVGTLERAILRRTYKMTNAAEKTTKKMTICIIYFSVYVDFR